MCIAKVNFSSLHCDNSMASKRARKAPVWTYMEQVSPDTTVCLVCKDTLKYNGNTSSMTKHLRTKHPLEYADMSIKIAPCIDGCIRYLFGGRQEDELCNITIRLHCPACLPREEATVESCSLDERERDSKVAYLNRLW